MKKREASVKNRGLPPFCLLASGAALLLHFPVWFDRSEEATYTMTGKGSSAFGEVMFFPCGKSEARDRRVPAGHAMHPLKGELLLYITPPEKHEVIDRYFSLGASRIACSLEVWDDKLGASITPGKRSFTTKERHLDALTYIAETYGPGKAFCNFIIGLEPFETLKEGATYLARRGVIPSASVWMPFGKPVNGSMKPASLEYFRKTKEMLGDLYQK